MEETYQREGLGEPDTLSAFMASVKTRQQAESVVQLTCVAKRPGCEDNFTAKRPVREYLFDGEVVCDSCYEDMSRPVANPHLHLRFFLPFGGGWQF